MKKYEEMIRKAISMLENDDELFCDMVNELDSWNGFADGFRCYRMDELDELFYGCSLTDFLDKISVGNFDLNDEYFVDTIYGLETVNDMAEHYRDNVDTGELLDEIIENSGHIWCYDDEFEELINDIINYSEDDEAIAA